MGYKNYCRLTGFENQGYNLDDKIRDFDVKFYFIKTKQNKTKHNKTLLL